MIGQQLGPYAILAKLGEGGMGEVYRARDTRLGREVAIKVLPAAVASDPERLRRFELEARATAALNHPNILVVFDVGRDGNTAFVVEELLEGRSLRDVVTAGAVPVRKAVDYASQIARGLAAAHGRNIVHRDLKPENIFVTPDDQIKILDFGLARVVEASPDGAAATTMEKGTGAGVVLGTVGYMAPEQVRGLAVDHRADIFSFGVVLYELLSGRRAFAGDTPADTMTAILRETPTDLESTGRAIPPALARIVERCLEKMPPARFQSASDLAFALQALGSDARVPSGATAIQADAVPRRWSPTRWLATAVTSVVVAGLAASLAWRLKPEASVPMRLFELPSALADTTTIALSADGSHVAYVFNHHLFVRAFDALDGKDLGPINPGVSQLFWSPDGRTIGFAAEGAIHTMPSDGGADFVVCKIPASGRILGAAWLRTGTIAFSVWRDSLYSVPASGGTPTITQAVDPATEIDFHAVSALPDGRLVVVSHRRNTDASQIELLDGKRRVVITSDPTVSTGVFAAPDHVLLIRNGANAGLWAARFTGGPIDVNHAVLIQAGASTVAAADNGTLLVSLPEPYRATLTWVDRAGTLTAAPGAPVTFEGPRALRAGSLALSPDGRRAAFLADGAPAETTASDRSLIVRDLTTGADTPLTLAGSNEARPDVGLQWSPQGDRVLATRGTIEAAQLLAFRADMVAPPRVVTNAVEGTISADGRTIVLLLDNRGHARLAQASIAPDGTIGPVRAVFHGVDPDINTYSLSPDGHTIAYGVTQDSTRVAVFLADLRDTSGQVLVTDGGTVPHFSSDGHELFYIQGVTDERGRGKGVLMARSVMTATGISLGPAAALFDDSGSIGRGLPSYTVAPNGKFLMWRPADGAPDARRLVLVQNWPALLQKR